MKPYLRFIRAKDGGYVLETDAKCEVLFNGESLITFLHLPRLEDFPSPLLEDMFHEINAELTLRDRKEINEKL